MNVRGKKAAQPTKMKEVKEEVKTEKGRKPSSKMTAILKPNLEAAERLYQTALTLTREILATKEKGTEAPPKKYLQTIDSLYSAIDKGSNKARWLLGINFCDSDHLRAYSSILIAAKAGEKNAQYSRGLLIKLYKQFRDNNDPLDKPDNYIENQLIKLVKNKIICSYLGAASNSSEWLDTMAILCVSELDLLNQKSKDIKRSEKVRISFRKISKPIREEALRQFQGRKILKDKDRVEIIRQFERAIYLGDTHSMFSFAREVLLQLQLPLQLEINQLVNTLGGQTQRQRDFAAVKAFALLMQAQQRGELINEPVRAFDLLIRAQQQGQHEASQYVECIEDTFCEFEQKFKPELYGPFCGVLLLTGPVQRDVAIFLANPMIKGLLVDDDKIKEKIANMKAGTTSTQAKKKKPKKKSSSVQAIEEKPFSPAPLNALTPESSSEVKKAPEEFTLAIEKFLQELNADIQHNKDDALLPLKKLIYSIYQTTSPQTEAIKIDGALLSKTPALWQLLCKGLLFGKGEALINLLLSSNVFDALFPPVLNDFFNEESQQLAFRLNREWLTEAFQIIDKNFPERFTDRYLANFSLWIYALLIAKELNLGFREDDFHKIIEEYKIPVVKEEKLEIDLKTALTCKEEKLKIDVKWALACRDRFFEKQQVTMYEVPARTLPSSEGHSARFFTQERVVISPATVSSGFARSDHVFAR